MPGRSSRGLGGDAPSPTDHELPLYRQLYLRLRDAILGGTLRPGQRLASSRALASQMGLARNTVLQAYGQLEVEGYIQAARGSGHRVSPLLPTSTPARRGSGSISSFEPVPASVRNGFEFVPESLRHPMAPVPFRINYPELQRFPIDAWTRLQGTVLREARQGGGGPGTLLGEADAQGEPELRRAIADHVTIARGVRCAPESVIVTAGAQHAIELLLRVLTRPGDTVALEDPCFPGALSAALAAGCRVAPVPVDAHGPDLAAARGAHRHARVLLVCPSTQFPLGVTMSLPRRLALIDWAQRNGAWIVEDDYDSEYRFDGKPIPSLQGLDGGEHVVYVGTFSKVLFPSLRTGFIVCPPSLVAPLSAARAVSGRHGSVLEQRVLARFVDEGHLGRHVRRMRTLYRERQAALRDACCRLQGRLTVEGARSGLQTIAWLAPRTDDRAVAARALALGIEAAPLSRFTICTPRAPALVLGFGGFEPAALRRAVVRLDRLLR